MDIFMMRSLFSKKLEKISKDIFNKYPEALSKLIGSNHGVYALYDENELYYVGKASDLKRRIRQHLRDRHYAQWTHFSLFLTNKSVYINDIESVVISISNPKGNRTKPKGSADIQLKKQLKNLMEKQNREEMERLLGPKKRINKKKIKKDVDAQSILKNLFEKQMPLYREYKGKEYKATLLISGKIKYNDKLYTSPSGAALAIVHGRAINGWDFWYIKNKEGNWVKLSSLR